MRHIAAITAIASVFSLSVPAMAGTESADSTTVLNEVVVTGTNSKVPQNCYPILFP